MAEYKIPAGAAAAEITARRFGGPTQIQEADVTIGTSAAAIFGNNPRRVAWTITNRGSADVNVSFQQSVVAGGGFVLAASGGSIESYVDEDGETVAAALYGISGSAGQTVRVVQTVRV